MRYQQRPFLKELRGLVSRLRKMRPGESHVFSVNANYGHYQLAVGPGARRTGRGAGAFRPIEINGEIHHLFLTPRSISALPSKEQVAANLRNTVIVRGLAIHLCDPRGDGKHLMPANGNGNGIHAREFINLAGTSGRQLIEEVEHSEEMSLEAYRIIQQDILRALKRKEKRRSRVSHTAA
jgi:hypothetical protein